ncbi:cell surface leucine-rich repeat-containing protein [methanogenic archaeon ISO4-H5]|nr:cell surface leucine-rich repeat-containing protein [methanogenic archaeon ISO4-H5]
MYRGTIIVMALTLACCLLMAIPGYSDADGDQPVITLDVPVYDGGNLSYSGTSTTGIVNLRLYSADGTGYSSVIDASIVENGSYSGTVNVGVLEEGRYELRASYNQTIVSRTFLVGEEYIAITSVSFEDGLLRYSGETNASLLNAVVYNDDYRSVIIASIPQSGSFSEIVNLGELQGGDYTLKVMGVRSERTTTFSVDGEPMDQSTYSEDGKILIVCRVVNGSEYVIPSHVEEIADSAFDNSNIDKLVLTKDLEWNITIKDNMFPMQIAGITELEIQDGVTTIPDYLFACTDIERLVIPSSVRTIGVKAFYNCPNLSHVEFQSNSKIQTIGQFAFSNNPSLRDVQFGSSADGYSCSLEKGCFYSSSLGTVRFDNQFNLYSIGDGCFANCSIFSMLIGDENGKITHIPGTVGYIGHSAFAYVQPATTTQEPGKNTFAGLIGYTKGTNFLTESISEYELVFQSNNTLTRVEPKCFEGKAFNKIDLSECHILESIGAGSFNGCLNVGNNNLILPSSIKTIEDGAFKCNGQPGNVKGMSDIELTVPASVESVGEYAFSGLSNIISFESNSRLQILKEVSPSDLYRLVDLSNCHELNQLYADRSPVKSPVGLFFVKYTGFTVIDGAPVAKISNNRLDIGADTVAIALPRDNFGNVTCLSDSITITCSSSNPYFRYIDGVLTINDGVQNKILYITSKTSIRFGSELTSGTIIAADSLSDSLKTLYIDNPNIRIENSLIEGSNNLRSVFITTNPTSWSIPQVFSSVPEGISFYVPNTLSQEDLLYLMGAGDVYVGYTSGNRVIYVPVTYHGSAIHLDNIVTTDNSFSADITSSGLVSDEVDYIAMGACVSTDGNRVTITNYSGAQSIVILKMMSALKESDRTFTVQFDGCGGTTHEGDGIVTLSVSEGSAIDQLCVPVFYNPLHMADGWVDENGDNYTIGSVVDRDMVLKQVWKQRAPIIKLDQSSAMIYLGGEVSSSTILYSGGQLELVAEPRPGYELVSWVVNGASRGSASEPLVLSNLSSDTEITLTYRYYSLSSDINSINNTGLPTMDDISELVRSYVLGGYVDTSMSTWKGTVSVPLVVDNFTYIRIAESLYKVESDTGYVVKRVDSQSSTVFYHHLGYGNGVIIDYNSSKVYDLDLNQLYILDRSISSAYYYNGSFYVLGEKVYSFDPVDEDLSIVGETKSLEYVGAIDNIYGSYGTFSHEFVGNILYCITAEGNNRGVAAMNLMTGESSYKNLSSITSMYLDDGWMSYYNGYLFLTAYSEGLFGAVASTNGDRIVYLPVEGMTFGEERYYESTPRTFSGRMAVYDGRAFVTLGGSLLVFELPNDMTNLNLDNLVHRSTTLVGGHGNFVLDVSHIEEEGSPIYAYGIPYDTHYNETLWIAVDRAGTASSMPLYSTEREWNSQAIRSDIDGRMLWYNDSGWLYSYTTSDKNVYYFFIEDGDSAIWYRVYGANAADALASLGDNVATLNAAKIIQTVNGHSVTDEITLQMLKATYGTTDNNGQFNNLDQYSWVNITNLGDTSYSLNHYFRIICGNGSSVSPGDVFTHIDNGETKTYTFADNIGDRSIIGKQLSRGTDVVYIRFVEDNTEIPGTASIVKRGSEAKVHFPEVVKVGYVPIWKNASGEEVADIYGQTISSDATFYLSWQELPAGYVISGTMDVSDGVTTWSADVDIRTGIGTTDGLSIKVTAMTSDGRVLTDIKTTGTNGLASGSLNAANIRLMYIRIVDEHVEGNLGYVMIEREATA